MGHNLTEEQTTELLNRLTSDSTFHKSFADDPEAVLLSMELPTDLAACLKGKQLASMQSIRESRVAISSLLSDPATAILRIVDLVAK